MSGGASAVFPATSVLLVEDTILVIYRDGVPAFQTLQSGSITSSQLCG